ETQAGGADGGGAGVVQRAEIKGRLHAMAAEKLGDGRIEGARVIDIARGCAAPEAGDVAHRNGGNAASGVAAASDAGSPSVVRLNPALDVGKLVVKNRLNPQRTVSTVVGFSVAVALACVASILRKSRLWPGDATLPNTGGCPVSPVF